MCTNRSLFPKIGFCRPSLEQFFRHSLSLVAQKLARLQRVRSRMKTKIYFVVMKRTALDGSSDCVSLLLYERCSSSTEREMRNECHGTHKSILLPGAPILDSILQTLIPGFAFGSLIVFVSRTFSGNSRTDDEIFSSHATCDEFKRSENLFTTEKRMIYES